MYLPRLSQFPFVDKRKIIHGNFGMAAFPWFNEIMKFKILPTMLRFDINLLNQKKSIREDENGKNPHMSNAEMILFSAFLHHI